ncbi:MAG: glycosyltransferase family 4 protein [Acidimicrobiales bacterium]|nr:glycosyltransferase family 4 protein [Acidimicrobiales bacterium]
MTDSRRITFVALAYAPSVGGSQLHVQRLAEGLALAGHDVEVLTTDAVGSIGARHPGRIEATDEVIAGVRVRRHRTPEPLRRVQRAFRGAWLRRPPWASGPRAHVVGPWLAGPLSPSLLASISVALRERDLVVACSAPFVTFVAPPRWPRRGAIVVGMPLLHLTRSEVALGVRRSLRRCDVLVASTEHERAVHRRYAGATTALHLIPPGADLDEAADCEPAEARARLGLPERPTVGYVGRLAAYKGIDTLLAAVAQLWETHPEVGVLVAGRPSGYDVAQAASDAGIDGERLVIRESFPDEDRGSLLAACDILAVPSHEESFGLGIAEGWAARRAVVASDIPAVRSLVRPGVDAQLVEPGDPLALASALAALIVDGGSRTRLADAGRRRVEDELRWSVAVDRWDALVRSSTGGRSREVVS